MEITSFFLSLSFFTYFTYWLTCWIARRSFACCSQPVYMKFGKIYPREVILITLYHSRVETALLHALDKVKKKQCFLAVQITFKLKLPQRKWKSLLLVLNMNKECQETVTWRRKLNILHRIWHNEKTRVTKLPRRKNLVLRRTHTTCNPCFASTKIPNYKETYYGTSLPLLNNLSIRIY